MSKREEEYKKKGVEIVAVNAFEDRAVAREWIASSGLDLHWAFADEAATTALGINAVPSQILLDPEGKVVWVSNFGSIMSGAEATFEAIDAAL